MSNIDIIHIAQTLTHFHMPRGLSEHCEAMYFDCLKLWPFCNIGRYGPSQYGHKYGLYWCLFEIQQKRRPTAKTVSKNMRLAKSYDQNKLFAQIMAISFVFWPNFAASLRDP